MNTLNLQPETLYTSEEVSEYLHLSLRTIQRLLQSGSLSSYKIHGQYRIKGLDLMNYLDGVRRDLTSLPAEDGKPAQLLDELEISPVSLSLALDLVHLVDPAQSPDFIQALQDLRKNISLELGFILPGVQLRDDSTLASGHYRVLIHGQAVAGGRLEPVDPEVLLKAFAELIRRFAHEILSRDEVFVMVDRLRAKHPVLVDEVLSFDGVQAGKLTIGQLTRVLRHLLSEQISIRHLALILEILSDCLDQDQKLQNLNPEALAEKVRQGLSRQLCEPLADAEGVIGVIGIAPEFEDALREALAHKDARLLALTRQLHAQLKQQPGRVLLCGADLRPRLRELLQRNFGHWHVLSYQEIDRLYRLELLASLALEV